MTTAATLTNLRPVSGRMFVRIGLWAGLAATQPSMFLGTASYEVEGSLPPGGGRA